MKKLLLTALAFGAVAISSSAQDRIFNNPDNKAFFGIRVAGEVTISGNVGMLNMLKDAEGMTFHENRVSFTLGYNF